MKKSSIRKLFLMIMACTLSFLHAGEKIKLTVTPDFSITNGIIQEYVFNKNCPNTGNLESRLDWDIVNLKTAGIKTDFLFTKGFFSSFSVKAGFPTLSGNMQDYDWLNFLFWKDEDLTELTNYSIHDNYIENYFSFSCRAGYTFNTIVNITPFAAYEYETYFFDGKDGYGKYKQYNFEQTDFSGKVISYELKYNTFFLGLTAECSAVPHAYFKAEVLVSPGMTWLDAYDSHYSTGYGYYDTVYNAFQLKTSVSAAFSINEHHSFGIDAGLSYMPVSTGKDYSTYLTQKGTFPETNTWKKYAASNILGGSSRNLWTISIFYRVKI